MPNIKLSDNFSLNLDIAPNPLSLFARYLKAPGQASFPKLNVTAIANTTIDQVAFNSADASINFSSPIDLGVSVVELTVKASAGATLSVIKPGETLAKDFFGGPVLKATAPSHYLGLKLEGKLSASLSATVFNISLGFNPGASIELINYKEFNPTGSPLVYAKFSDALETTIKEFSIPGDVDDLLGLSEGTIVAANGSGTLKFSAKTNLLTVANPLLTLSLLPSIEQATLNISSSASITVGASFELSSQYQMRLRKLPGNIVELGYFRQESKDFAASISASLGLSASIANFDLLEQLVKAITNDPEELESTKTGLNNDQLKQINAAISEAIQRKLAVSLNYEYSNSNSQQAAFLFEIDLNTLSPNTRNALHDALDGDLSLLINSDGTGGVTLKRSLLKDIAQQKHQLKINLFGIFHFISISKLLKVGSVLYDKDTGDLIIADQATATRIRASIFSFFVLSKPLCKVLAESLTITTAYQASNIAQAPNLQVAHWYYELHSKTTPQILKDNLDVFVALDLLAFADIPTQLQKLNTKGETSFYLETSYDQNLAQKLFLDNSDTARSMDLYEKAGRRAIELLVRPGEQDDYRRIPVTNDAIWQQMKSLGQFNFQTIPAFSHFTNIQIAVLASDFSLIIWWAESMHKLAQSLQEIIAYLKTPDADLRSHDFNLLRNNLLSRMADVANDTKFQFDDPWGLLAMSQVSFLALATFPHREAKLISTNNSLFLNK